MNAVDHSQLVIWAVIFCYMAIIAGAGSYYARYMKSADAYFKAGNQIPWWAAGISMYMANFTAYTFVGIASMVYMRGMPALLLETGPALAFAVAALVMAPRWYRLNIASPPEYLERRFNPLTRHLFSVLGILARLIGNGVRLFSMSKFIESVTGIPTTYMILITGVVVIAYTVLGGLWAVIITDVLQFVVLMLAVIPMLIVSGRIDFPRRRLERLRLSDSRWIRDISQYQSRRVIPGRSARSRRAMGLATRVLVYLLARLQRRLGHHPTDVLHAVGGRCAQGRLVISRVERSACVCAAWHLLPCTRLVGGRTGGTQTRLASRNSFTAKSH